MGIVNDSELLSYQISFAIFDLLLLLCAHLALPLDGLGWALQCAQKGQILDDPLSRGPKNQTAQGPPPSASSQN